VGQRELESGLEELTKVRPADVLLGGDLADAEDLNAPEPGTVTGGHVLVEGLDGGDAGKGAELLVHVVRAGTRVVTKPDTKVLDLEGLLFVDLE
jgi:hypothetical protein